MTDDAVMAALDPAGGGHAGEAAREHAADCEACRAALAEARTDESEVATLLGRLDHPVPEVDVAQLITRARAHHSPAFVAATRETPIPAARWGRWTVGLAVLGTAAVAAAVAPRSPVRAFLQHVLESRTAAPPQPTAPPAAPLLPAAPRGVAFVPTGSIDVIFRIVRSSGVIHVVEDTGARVSVQADGAGVTYAVGQDTIVVTDTAVDAGNFTVRLPSAARLPHARVFVGGRRVYTRAPDRTESSGTPRGNGGYDILLVP